MGDQMRRAWADWLAAECRAAPVLVVRPHLVMSILGQDFEIFGIDIPIALPETDEELVFDPQPMSFDAPEPPPAADTGVDESGEGGADGATTEAGTDATGEATAGTETDTDGAAFGGDDRPTGCGCRGGTPSHGGLLALGLAALGLLRRRRSRHG